jgi:archaellum component FlaC
MKGRLATRNRQSPRPFVIAVSAIPLTFRREIPPSIVGTPIALLVRRPTMLSSSSSREERHMSEARLERIESTVEQFAAGQQMLGVRLDGVETRLDRVETRLDRVETRLDRVETRLDRVEMRLGGVETRLGGVESRVEDLDRHMHVLHEDVIDRIRSLANPDAITKRDLQRGFDELREAIGRRLDPLEATVRRHTDEIEQLQRRDRA